MGYARLAAVILWIDWLCTANFVYAVPLAELDDTKEWRIEDLAITGNAVITEEELRNEILTKDRPWYQIWSARPVFDPVTFESDLGRLRRLYEARGYYHAQIAEDVSADESNSRVLISIRIDEGPPVVIAAVEVNVMSELAEVQRPALPDRLPVATGDVFREAAYLEAEQKLREVFLHNGFAHVDSTRRAEINLDDQRAQIEYSVTPGPPTVFGETEIRGASSVAPNLIERELAYRPGEIFSGEKVAATRAKLLALDLFSSVRVGPESTVGHPRVVPMAVEVNDKPHREIKLGVGYSTEEEFRSQLEWRHLNWLGGGRRLSVQAKYSSVAASGAVDLVQPHVFSPAAKGSLGFKYEQQEEDTYHRNFGRFLPKFDYQFMPGLSGFVGFRAEYNRLFEISQATEQALGSVRKRGWVSGPALGLVWNTTDNPFEPKKGAVLSLTLEQAGAIWGGAYRFYKITGEAKKYFDIGWETILAGKVKLGLGDAIGAEDRFPLFERYYAGGENSVRGYGRRRLGPLSDSDDPLGGLSLLEGSLELRRPIWRDLGGALFIDFGQVATRPFDIRVTNLDFSAGFGFSYKTPVGPVRLDVGFPFQKPPKDRSWQIHFSIGALF
jgi:outer membrane protein assembly complex protein YaeT